MRRPSPLRVCGCGERGPHKKSCTWAKSLYEHETRKGLEALEREHDAAARAGGPR